jgi:hypothetical protein
VVVVVFAVARRGGRGSRTLTYDGVNDDDANDDDDDVRRRGRGIVSPARALATDQEVNDGRILPRAAPTTPGGQLRRTTTTTSGGGRNNVVVVVIFVVG